MTESNCLAYELHFISLDYFSRKVSSCELTKNTPALAILTTERVVM